MIIMRICFFGHAEFTGSNDLRLKLSAILRDYVDKYDCEFFFGGYGGFDDFAYSCVKDLTSPNSIQKIFVTPYITESYLRNQVEYRFRKYDGIIYPEIEKTPYKLAIIARNRWMVERSDIVIVYVSHSFGGAYNTYSYARQKKKNIINLAEL